MLIDTHAHLEFEPLISDLDEVVKRAHNNDVKKIITLGVDLERAKKAIDIAKKYNNIYAAIGIHPDDATENDINTTMLQLEKMIIPKNKIVAIGETGLDYYRTEEKDREHVEKAQKAFFEAHITLAKKHNLPVIVHLRHEDTYDDAYQILQRHAPLKAVVHCYSGTKEFAQKLFDLGIMISITGIVTFKNAQELQSVVKYAPLDRMMIETDAPYLAPTPYRGKTNEPSYVKHVAEKIADLKNLSYEEVAKTTTQNAEDFFGI